MSAISSTAGAISGATSPDTTANAKANLTEQNFLQLLVTQMTSQDPLNPESSTDFAAQLAQFSSLQETTASANTMANLQAASLIGANVSVQSNSGGTSEVTGPVTGVDFSSGTPEIQVNGQLYGLSSILSIAPAQTAATSTPATTTPTSSQ
jgi:flagellar basal-body rod modification protein FlgD